MNENTNHTLVAENVTKTIKGRNLVDHVSFELESGTYGFVGENGSGKTMLLRVLCGLVHPDEGTVKLDGSDIYAKKRPELNIGVIIENNGLWPHLTGFENLLYLSKLKKIIGKAEVRAALVRVGLDPDNKLPARKYSLGMKQRLMIAQAVMEKPDFLFMDEPTNALDKDGAELVRKILAEEAERGALVLIASHVSRDISSLCKTVYMIEEGRCSLKAQEAEAL